MPRRVQRRDAREEPVNLDCHTSTWLECVERSPLGYTYVRLYRGAPETVRNAVINHFGKGTVFLRPAQPTSLEA